MLERHTLIEDWTEDHLSTIPDAETDYYEYKSSQTPLERLKHKIYVAASAFWNSGGGVFIAGVDDNGRIDGGVPAYVGGQKLRDWADQVLAQVEPVGPYAVKSIEATHPDSRIRPNCAVLVIAFGESANAPHMGPDYRYYVRAGAHSVPAGHFLVEAIRSRRGLHKPFLRGLLRLHENKTHAVELAIVSANDATALDVHISFDPFPTSLEDSQDRFPLSVPIIDRDNPFAMDIFHLYKVRDRVGDQRIFLELQYQDVAGQVFNERQELDPIRSLSPVRVESDDVDVIKKSLRDIVRQMKRLNSMIEKFQQNGNGN
jgi:hypothetical protein